MQAVCAAHGVPLAAAALRCCLRPPGVSTVIAGADHPSHVERNVQTVEIDVSAALLDTVLAT